MINVQFSRNPPEIPQNPALIRPGTIFSIFIFTNVISVSPYTLYSNFSFLSSIIRFCWHKNGSIFQKSPKLPYFHRNPALILAPGNLLKIQEITFFIGFPWTTYNNFSLLSWKIKIWQHNQIFFKNCQILTTAGRQECPGPPNSWRISKVKVLKIIKEDLVHTWVKTDNSNER